MLKTDPKYGVYPWWPVNGDGWLHPEDVATARQMIPSYRVFRRDGRSGSFGVLHYGPIRLRVRPTLWLEVRPEGFEIGDWVEVKSRGMKNTPWTGRIREMRFDPWSKRIQYQLRVRDMPIETRYHAEDLLPIEPIQPNVWAREIRPVNAAADLEQPEC